jgi:hypothetical protein
MVGAAVSDKNIIFIFYHLIDKALLVLHVAP